MLNFLALGINRGNYITKVALDHVDYKGIIGRKKLRAYYENIELSEEAILRRLQKKMDGLLRQYSKEDMVDPPRKYESECSG